jgi:glycine cleavage system H lipoate-binding protein
MKGRIGFRLCTNDYQCPTCEFDQYFDDQHTVRAMVIPLDISHIRGFKIPQGYYLHEGHAWAMLEEGPYVRVGMDDFSLRLLGLVDAVEAPLVGKRIQQGQPDTTVRKGGKSATVMSPVSGIVTDINPHLREKGALAADNPYSDGWVMRVHAENLREDLKHLMIHAETVDFLDKEIDSLYRLIEAEAGPMATDGGVLAPDISGNLPQVDWNRLASQFLRTQGV